MTALVHGCLIRDRAARCPNMEELRGTLARFTVGTDRLQENTLQPLAKEWATRKAARAVLPSTWTAAAPSIRPPSAEAAAGGSLVGARLAGRYEVTAEIGAGGTGVVFDAVSSTGQPVAIKVIRTDTAPAQGDRVARFVREARTPAIKSNRVVRVLDLGTEPQVRVPFIVLERLRGADLQAWLDKHRALDPAVAAEVFVQVCRGVKAAHAAGVVHRNVKPSNLFLHEQPDGTILVKVCDFGTAKITEVEDNERTVRALTSQGAIVGSPKYLSPEQAQNPRTVDHRTDIWGVGISLYQALTSKPPWANAESLGQLIFAICTTDLPALAEAAPSVPPGMVQAIQRALQRNRDARMANLDEMEAALEPFAKAARPLRKETLGARLMATAAVPQAAAVAAPGQAQGTARAAGKGK